MTVTGGGGQRKFKQTSWNVRNHFREICSNFFVAFKVFGFSGCFLFLDIWCFCCSKWVLFFSKTGSHLKRSAVLPKLHSRPGPLQLARWYDFFVSRMGTAFSEQTHSAPGPLDDAQNVLFKVPAEWDSWNMYINPGISQNVGWLSKGADCYLQSFFHIFPSCLTTCDRRRWSQLATTWTF